MSGSRSGFVTFRPRARLLKLLGSELISDDVVAITELVKNSHDADASRVAISFRNVSSSEGEITISDDGCGMDLDGLLTGWMEPAGSSKRSKSTTMTRGGRRVLGEKGVGRFAADKLGSRLELVTRARGSAHEVCAAFDWDLFDSDTRMLSDVRNRWESRPARTLAGSGTRLVISGLRAAWTERAFRRLSMRLSRLKSPFMGRDRFSIEVESTDFPEYSGEVAGDFLERSPYRLELTYDGARMAVLLNGKQRASPVPDQLTAARCGPVNVRLHAFDLETEAIARIGPRMETRAWLREWSGISVYRDGFRVWPYGEPHDDWLRLDQRRVNNPVVCLSNNQVVGFVEIGLDANPELRDQTNREGLIHNEALEDLRRLVLHALHLLEVERQRVRHPVSRGAPPRPKVTESSAIVARLQGVAGTATGRLGQELKRLTRDLGDWIGREEVDRARFTQGYSDLATIGHVSIGLAQGLQPVLDELREDTVRLLRNEEESPVARRLLSRLDLVDGQVGLLAKISSAGALRRRAIDVLAEIDSTRELLMPLLAARDGDITVKGEQGGVLRAEVNPHSLQRVLFILTENTLDWVPRGRPPRIEISTRADLETCDIVVSDNGPGIDRSIAEQVFVPLFSMKDGGRGMGLALARNLLEQHGGDISLIQDGRRRGAAFRIRLPRKLARATRHGVQSVAHMG